MDATQSPIPKKTEVNEPEMMLKFTDIISHLLAGKKIHKLGWEDQENYVVLDKTVLKLHKSNGKLHEWILSKEDLEGDDWIIVKKKT